MQAIYMLQEAKINAKIAIFGLFFKNAYLKIHFFIINNYFQIKLVLLLVINLLYKSNNMQKVYQTRHCKNG